MMGDIMKLTIVAGALFVCVGIAHAAPIAAGSELSIKGSDTFTNNQINFVGLADVGGTSGDFNILPLCNACVTMIPTLTATSSGLLYNVGDAGQTSALVLHPPQSFVSDGTAALPSLTVQGTGTLTLSGRDATEGQWELTTQRPGGDEAAMAQVTFSATSIPQGAPGVPEPSSLLLLGAGVAGLASARRRSRSLGNAPAR